MAPSRVRTLLMPTPRMLASSRSHVITLALALSAVATAACSNDVNVGAPPAAPVDWHAFDRPKVADAGIPGPTDRERVAGKAYVAAMATPGMTGLATVLDTDSHFAFPGMPDGRGRDGAIKAHENLLGAFDGRVFAVSREVRTDAAMSIEWTMSGTQAKDWMGVTATKKPVVIRGVTLLWTRDDGLVTDVHTVFDVAAVKVQLGAGPKELATLPVPAMAAGATQDLEQTRSADETSNAALVHTWLDTVEKADEAPYLALLTDDFVLENTERPAPVKGKDEAKAYLKAIHKAIGSLDSRTDNVFAVGSFVVAEYSLNGDQIGPIGWVPAKADRVVRLHVIDVIELRGGKIAHVTRYDSPGEIIIGG